MNIKSILLSVLIASFVVVTLAAMIVYANAAKEFVVDCTTHIVGEGNNVRYQIVCCTYEVDTETGERRLVENCWVEEEWPADGGCPGCFSQVPEDGMSPGNREVLPPETTQRDDRTSRIPDQGEVLSVPSEASTQEDVGITDRPVEEREALPTTPSTPLLGETSPLQPPSFTVEDEGGETTPGPETCMKGEIFNEETGQCESAGESVPEGLSQTKPVEGLDENNSDESETTPGPEACMKGEIYNEETGQCESIGESVPEGLSQTKPEIQQQPSSGEGS